jgi:hypothetical protein
MCGWQATEAARARYPATKRETLRTAMVDLFLSVGPQPVARAAIGSIHRQGPLLVGDVPMAAWAGTVSSLREQGQ